MKLSEVAKEYEPAATTPKINKVKYDGSTLAETETGEHIVYIGKGLAPENLSGRCLVLTGEWTLAKNGSYYVLIPA